jgi:Type II secretory pathway, component PulD
VLGDILGVNYSIDPRVQGTVSLTSVHPVPKSDILYVLESALRLSGTAVVRDAGGYRLIPVGDAVGSGSIDAGGSSAEPGYGISVVPLQYVSAQTLLKLLDSFALKPGMVRADTGRNLLLIQGSGAERRTAVEAALSFDADWMKGQSVGVFPIANGNPEPIVTELEKIMDTGESGMGQNVVKFQTISRMNAIMVITRKPALLRTAETWIKRLDSANTSKNTVHVYRIKYGEARQIARVLTDMFIGNSGSGSMRPRTNWLPVRALPRVRAWTGCRPVGPRPSQAGLAAAINRRPTTASSPTGVLAARLLRLQRAHRLASARASMATARLREASRSWKACGSRRTPSTTPC